MVDLAAAELGIDPIELRRRNMIPPEAMPFKSGLTFTYDCGEFEKGLDMALELADFAGFESRRAESRGRGKLRGFGISNTIERAAAGGFEAAEIRFDRSGTVTLMSGSITQGQGHETVYKQLLCDRLGIDPDQVHYVQGDTDKVAIGEGTGGSRSAALGGSAVHLATEKIVTKAKAIAGPCWAPMPTRSVSRTASSRRRARTARLTVGEIARESLNPQNLPEGMDLGLIAGATFSCKEQNFPNGCHICELEIDERDRRGRDPALQRRRRCRHGDEPAIARGPDLRRHRAGRGPGADGGHPLRPGLGPAADRLLHGLRDAAGRQPLGDPLRKQPGADRDQPARRQGCGRSRQCRRAARRSATRWSTPSPRSASATSKCPPPPSASGARSRRQKYRGSVYHRG